MGALKSNGRSRMSNGSLEEFTVGTCLVRVYADQVLMPGVVGWVGVWAIYRLPRVPWDSPVRFGDTDLEASQTSAIGMARAVAKLVARSL